MLESGADVSIVARGEEALSAAVKSLQSIGGGRVVGVQADVAIAAEVERAYAETMSALGRIDVVMNNAGVSRAVPFEQLTDAMLLGDLEQKVFAAIRMIRLVLPQLKERRWGRIINVLSIGAKVPLPNSTPSTISRAAGLSLTKTLSHELAPHNVLVNALCVGFIEADQHVQAAARQGVEWERFVEKRAKEIPLGRIGLAEEFANAACFLASDASSYITGTALNVDGGRSPAV